MLLTTLRLLLALNLAAIPIVELAGIEPHHQIVLALVGLAFVIWWLGVVQVEKRNARQIQQAQELHAQVKHAALGSAAWLQEQITTRLRIRDRRDP